jgi:hypothetical protein
MVCPAGSERYISLGCPLRSKRFVICKYLDALFFELGSESLNDFYWLLGFCYSYGQRK